MKNPTHGSLKIGVNGVIAAQHPHVVVFDGYEVETDGNLFAHLVLRGGDGRPNYSITDIAEAAKHIKAGDVANPSIIVDVSHDNCLVNGKKDYHAQSSIVLEVLNSLEHTPELKPLIKGFMLESFIKPGNQNFDTANPIDMGGLSITDPCLGWDETEQLIKEVSARYCA